MTAFHSNLKPPVGFDQGDKFADIHSAQFTPGTLDLRKKMRGSVAIHVLRAHCDDTLFSFPAYFLARPPGVSESRPAFCCRRPAPGPTGVCSWYLSRQPSMHAELPNVPIAINDALVA